MDAFSGSHGLSPRCHSSGGTDFLHSRSLCLLSDRTRTTEKCDRLREQCLSRRCTTSNIYVTRFRHWSIREPYSLPWHLVKSAWNGDGFSAQHPPQGPSLPPLVLTPSHVKRLLRAGHLFDPILDSQLVEPWDRGKNSCLKRQRPDVPALRVGPECHILAGSD